MGSRCEFVQEFSNALQRLSAHTGDISMNRFVHPAIRQRSPNNSYTGNETIILSERFKYLYMHTRCSRGYEGTLTLHYIKKACNLIDFVNADLPQCFLQNFTYYTMIYPSCS